MVYTADWSEKLIKTHLAPVDSIHVDNFTKLNAIQSQKNLITTTSPNFRANYQKLVQVHYPTQESIKTNAGLCNLREFVVT